MLGKFVYGVREIGSSLRRVGRKGLVIAILIYFIYFIFILWYVKYYELNREYQDLKQNFDLYSFSGLGEYNSRAFLYHYLRR